MEELIHLSVPFSNLYNYTSSVRNTVGQHLLQICFSLKPIGSVKEKEVNVYVHACSYMIITLVSVLHLMI